MVRIESEVVEIRDLTIEQLKRIESGKYKTILTSSKCFTSSPCLFAICFSTNEVALKSF